MEVYNSLRKNFNYTIFIDWVDASDEFEVGLYISASSDAHSFRGSLLKVYTHIYV